MDAGRLGYMLKDDPMRSFGYEMSESPMSEQWLRTDESEEAVATLESFAQFLIGVRDDPFAWRWAILSLYISTQGFMVIALSDSAHLVPLKDDIAEKWLKAHRAGTPYPETKLDSYRNLYAKVKRTSLAKHMQATPFKPIKSQGRSILLLGTLRDQFSHFLPMSWSLETSGLPGACRDILDFIEFLSSKYRTILWHNEDHPRRIALALQLARATLSKVI